MTDKKIASDEALYIKILIIATAFMLAFVLFVFVRRFSSRSRPKTQNILECGSVFGDTRHYRLAHWQLYCRICFTLNYEKAFRSYADLFRRRLSARQKKCQIRYLFHILIQKL